MATDPIPSNPPIADDYAHDMSLTGQLLRDLRRADDGSEIRTREDWERRGRDRSTRNGERRQKRRCTRDGK
jgi:hypothetical protein